VSWASRDRLAIRRNEVVDGRIVRETVGHDGLGGGHVEERD